MFYYKFHTWCRCCHYPKDSLMGEFKIEVILNSIIGSSVLVVILKSIRYSPEAQTDKNVLVGRVRLFIVQT